MEKGVQYLMEQPDVFLIIQKAQLILNREQGKREKLYAQITEQEKAEFINGEIIVHSSVKKKHNQVNG